MSLDVFTFTLPVGAILGPYRYLGDGTFQTILPLARTMPPALLEGCVLEHQDFPPRIVATAGPDDDQTYRRKVAFVDIQVGDEIMTFDGYLRRRDSFLQLTGEYSDADLEAFRRDWVDMRNKHKAAPAGGGS